jgi:phage terminase large subunit-like protein
MLIDIWRGLRSVAYDYAQRISDTEHRIELRGGGVVEMWSLERPDAARGRKYARVVIDEAAMVKDLQHVWPMVIRPTLADLAGDGFLFSTPRGRNGFWQFWQAAATDDEWARWQLSSSCNPFLPSDEIEKMRADLPERTYRQEIEAQFVDDGGGVFRGIAECATAELRNEPEPGHTYVAGVDIGRTSDYTVSVVVDANTGHVVAMDRYTAVGFAVQEERMVALCERWQPTLMVVEINNFGFPMVESLIQRGLPVSPFRTTNQTKAHIIERLAMAFEHRRIAIPDDATLIGELMAYEIETLPSGLIRYGAPSGMHDDCVMALAFAWYAAE